MSECEHKVEVGTVSLGIDIYRSEGRRTACGKQLPWWPTWPVVKIRKPVSQNALFVTSVVALAVLKVHERATGALRGSYFGSEAGTTLDFSPAFRANRSLGGL
jgi:hypothetical protein